MKSLKERQEDFDKRFEAARRRFNIFSFFVSAFIAVVFFGVCCGVGFVFYKSYQIHTENSGRAVEGLCGSEYRLVGPSRHSDKWGIQERIFSEEISGWSLIEEYSLEKEARAKCELLKNDG